MTRIMQPFGPGDQPAKGLARQPIFNLPPMTKAVALGLVAIHVALAIAGDGLRRDVVEAMAFVPALFAAQLAGGGFEPAVNLRLVSHMLVHADLAHLGLNVGFLLVFATVCERALGGWRTAMLLLASGIVGALAFTAVAPFDAVGLIGASGAVYGAAGAMTRLVFLRRGSVRGAVTFAAVLMAINLLLGAFGGAIFGGGQDIAWQAHIGGFAAGLALVFVLPAKARRLRPEH